MTDLFGKRRLEFEFAVGHRLIVERRDEDGMVWLCIPGPDPGYFAFVIPLDPDEAWAVAQAMLDDGSLS